VRPKVKYHVIHMNRDCYPVSVMCKFFQVSRSGYYDFVHRIGRKEKDAELAEVIRKQQERCFKTYGYRRMWLWLEQRGIEVIVPVPMFAAKKRSRGYNQAEVFARALGRECAVPVEEKLVVRTKNTMPQKSLNDKQRKDNLKGAFQVRTNIVKYSKILLVDDIYTTGATIDAIAELLKKSGAKEVYFLSICVGEGY